jgi:hypothetical protein
MFNYIVIAKYQLLNSIKETYIKGTEMICLEYTKRSSNNAFNTKYKHISRRLRLLKLFSLCCGIVLKVGSSCLQVLCISNLNPLHQQCPLLLSGRRNSVKIKHADNSGNWLLNLKWTIVGFNGHDDNFRHLVIYIIWMQFQVVLATTTA